MISRILEVNLMNKIIFSFTYFNVIPNISLMTVFSITKPIGQIVMIQTRMYSYLSLSWVIKADLYSKCEYLLYRKFSFVALVTNIWLSLKVEIL